MSEQKNPSAPAPGLGSAAPAAAAAPADDTDGEPDDQEEIDLEAQQPEQQPAPGGGDRPRRHRRRRRHAEEDEDSNFPREWTEADERQMRAFFPTRLGLSALVGTIMGGLAYGVVAGGVKAVSDRPLTTNTGLAVLGATTLIGTATNFMLLGAVIKGKETYARALCSALSVVSDRLLLLSVC